MAKLRDLTLEDLSHLIDESAVKWAALRNRPVLIFRCGTIGLAAVSQVHGAIRKEKLKELDVVMDSGGGFLHSAFKIAQVIRTHAEHVSGIVPRWAKSATTLMALAMDELVIGELGELGPLDSQRSLRSEREEPRQQSSLEVVKAMQETRDAAISLWDLSARLLMDQGLNVAGSYQLAAEFVGQFTKASYTKVDLKELGDSLRALETGQRYAVDLLKHYRKIDEADANRIAKSLVEDYPSHGFVIDADGAKELGLPARKSDGEEDDLLNELQQLFQVADVLEANTGKELNLIKLVRPVPATTVEGKPGYESPIMSSSSDQHVSTDNGTSSSVNEPTTPLTTGGG